MKTINTSLSLRIWTVPGFSNIGYTVHFGLLQNYRREGEDFDRSITIFSRQVIFTGSRDQQHEVANSLKSRAVGFIIELGYLELSSEIKKLQDINLSQKFLEQLTSFIKEQEPLQVSIIKPNPVIIRFNEKHGDRYFLAKTEEEAKSVYLFILTERFNSGQYNWMENYIPYEKSKMCVKFTSEEIDRLPETMGEVKQEMREALKKWEKTKVEIEETRERYQLIKTAVDIKDGVAAYEFLREQKESEYENFEIIEPENI